jgi:hypothetical protein
MSAPRTPREILACMAVDERDLPTAGLTHTNDSSVGAIGEPVASAPHDGGVSSTTTVRRSPESASELIAV